MSDPQKVDYKQLEDDVSRLLHKLQIRNHGLRQWSDDFKAALEKVAAHWATTKGFPLYLMNVGDKWKFLPLQRAGIVFDSGWEKVDTGKFVLNADLTVRPMTGDDERKISNIAETHSESK